MFQTLPLGSAVMPRRTKKPVRCEHCRMRDTYRGVLCWKCYAMPKIRAQYETDSARQRARCTEQERVTPLRIAPEPTPAAAGSQAKADVMAERIRRGYAPCHPLDGTATAEALASGGTIVPRVPFATKLRMLRKRAGLSRGQLAERTGLKLMTLRAYERNFRQPSIFAAMKLAEFFRVSVEKLIGARR